MLSMPIINTQSTVLTRPAFVHELRRAGADRVFVFCDNPFGDEKELDFLMNLLAENLAFYQSEGFDTGVWIGGFGHGGALAHTKMLAAGDYTLIKDLTTGGTSSDSFCPADPNYFAMFADFVCRCAKAGGKMIMIDDDLRLALHGPVSLGCACERHIALFNERVRDTESVANGHTYTREELAAVLFTGKANPLRKIWLDLMGDTLRDFARDLRKAVDAVDPTVRLGHCACLPTWDVDGADSIELAKLFAGNTRPFLRLIGAPYWTAGRSFNTTGLGSIIDIERMQLAWCKKYAPEVEVFTEGDVYTRPRYNVPSTYLEGFHQVLNAEGQSDGILKYMIDYSQHPFYETGYIDRHVHNAPLRFAQEQAFADKKTAGVYVHEVLHKLAGMDCTGIHPFNLSARFTPVSVNFANATSLPISFERNEYTDCAIVFGENTKYIDDDLAKLPMILDLTAAELLTEAGVDVGIRENAGIGAPGTEYFPDYYDATVPTNSGGRFAKLTLADGATADSTFTVDGAAYPMAYRYENADGRKFFVYAFDMETTAPKSDLFRSYPRQLQLFRAIEWLQGKPLPVEVAKEPGMYVLCRRNGDEMTVGLWNFWDDLGLPRDIRLGEKYSNIRPIGNTNATLSEDGRSVRIDGDIPPYGFAGFTVQK